MAPLDWEDDDEDEYQGGSDIDIDEDIDEDDVDYEAIAQDDAERRAFSDDDDDIQPDSQDQDGDEGDYSSSILQIDLPPDQASVNAIRDILFSQTTRTTTRLEDVVQLLQAAGARTNHRPVPRRSPPRYPGGQIYQPTTDPQPAGIELLLGGEFGNVGRNPHRRTGSRTSHNLAKALLVRSRSPRVPTKQSISSDVRPSWRPS